MRATRRNRFATADDLVEQHYEYTLALHAAFVGRLPPHVDRDALQGAALEALVTVARRYRPDRDAKFSTYARARIVGAMGDELRKLDHASRRERADGTAVPPPISLQTVVSDDETDMGTLGDLVASRRDTQAEALRTLEIREAFDTMTERELPIVLRSLAGERQQSIAADLGVTDSRVSQILARASERVMEAIGAHQNG